MGACSHKRNYANSHIARQRDMSMERKRNANDTARKKERYAYSWQNGFITAILMLLAKKDNEDVIKILKRWFNDESSARELYNFLYRLGAKPKSQDVNDLLNGMLKLYLEKDLTIKTPHQLD